MAEIEKGPGKFEGEPTWARYYWGISEYADADFGNVLFFIVENDILARDEDGPDVEITSKYPDLIGVYGIGLEETDQGFVYSETYKTAAEYNAAVEKVSNTESERE